MDYMKSEIDKRTKAVGDNGDMKFRAPIAKETDKKTHFYFFISTFILLVTCVVIMGAVGAAGYFLFKYVQQKRAEKYR